MTALSPSAQAVMDAAVTKITLSKKLAAALRAAADQVVPEVDLVGCDYEERALQDARRKLLAIAAELEGQP
jgi:hypothetical protein